VFHGNKNRLFAIPRPVALAVVAAALLVIAPQALANHNNTLCDSFHGNISNNNVYPLTYPNMNWSHWFYALDYIGSRQDVGGNETFRQLVAGGYELHVVTPDGNDRYLRTLVQRAGYSSTGGSMYE
jgi:hypothetical protein